MGLLAKHWGGGAPIPWLMTLRRRELMRWYAVYERQTEEERLVAEFLHPKEGKPRPLPSSRRLRAMVDERIAAKREREREEARKTER